MAGERSRLVDHPQPVLGMARCQCRSRDNPAYPRIDVYGRSGSWSAISAAAARQERQPGPAPAVRRRADPPQSRRPNQEVHDAPRPRRARHMVRLRLDDLRAGAPPVHNAEWFEDHFPGDRRRVHRADPRLVYTMPVLARAIFDRPASRPPCRHGIVLGSDGHEMSKSLHNYPDVNEVFDRDGPTRCARSSCRRRSCAAATSSSPSRASATPCARCCSRAWNTYLLLHAVRQRGCGGSGAPRSHRRRGRPLDRYLLAEPQRARRGDDRGSSTTYEVANACRLGPPVPRRADQLVRPRPRDPFWATTPDAFDTLSTALEVLCRGDGAAGAAAHRGGLARSDRRALGAPGGLPGGRGSASVVALRQAQEPPAVETPGYVGDVLVADDALVAAVESARAVVSQTGSRCARRKQAAGASAAAVAGGGGRGGPGRAVAPFTGLLEAGS